MNTTSAEKDDPDVRKEEFSRRGGHGEGPVELRCASTRRRLTPRQLEVLTRIRETGTAGPPEEGRRIDLTLSSLVRRRLVHRKTPGAKGEPIRYALSEEGEKHFRFAPSVPRSRAVEAFAVDLETPEKKKEEEYGLKPPEKYVPKPRDRVRIKDGDLKDQLGCVREVSEDDETAILCVLAGRTRKALDPMDWSHLELAGDPVQDCECN
jgi:hypothetical protein